MEPVSGVRVHCRSVLAAFQSEWARLTQATSLTAAWPVQMLQPKKSVYKAVQVVAGDGGRRRGPLLCPVIAPDSPTGQDADW